MTAEQFLERHPGFEPGQRRAQAVMDAVAEAETLAIAPADVERVWRRETARIAVRRGEAHQHLLAAGDLRAAESHRPGRHPEGGVRNRGREPDELLDRTGELTGVG